MYLVFIPRHTHKRTHAYTHFEVSIKLHALFFSGEWNVKIHVGNTFSAA